MKNKKIKKQKKISEIKQAEMHRRLNKMRKTNYKRAVKDFSQAIQMKKESTILQGIFSQLQKTASKTKSVFHRNKISRLVSNYHKKFKEAIK